MSYIECEAQKMFLYRKCWFALKFVNVLEVERMCIKHHFFIFFVFYSSGYLEYETALSLTRYLEHEMEVIVWYIVLKHMNSYKKSLVTYHSFPLLKVNIFCLLVHLCPVAVSLKKILFSFVN